MQPLQISHVCAVSSAGIGVEALHAALVARRSGLAPCAFAGAQLDTFAGQVADEHLAPVRPELAAFDCRNNRLGQLCAQQDGFGEAVREARRRYGAERVGVFAGTSTSGILETELAYRRRDPDTGALPASFRYGTTQNTFSLAWFMRSLFELRGPAHVVSVACASSAKVFADAARMIAAGVCDAAVVGGADSLCLTTLYGFNALGLLRAGRAGRSTSRARRPFDWGSARGSR